MSFRSQKGFTIIELFIGAAILAITLGLAGPSFVKMIKDNRVTSASNSFVTALQLGKMESAARSRPVTVCKSNADGDGCIGGGDWQQGWIVFADFAGDGGLNDQDELIFVHEALHDSITFGGTAGVANFITYNPTGTTSLTSTETLIICDERGFDDSARGILVAITGRGNVVKAENSGQTTCL